MPMIPTQGVTSPQGYGPGAPAQLGTGGYAGMDAMGGNPTDPSAPVQMSQLPQMAPTSIAEAIQGAIEQRQAELSAQQDQQRMAQLQSDLQEADAFVQQMMAMVGQEAMTADGGSAVPAAPPAAAPAGPPQGAGGGMIDAMSGMGGMPPGPAGAAALAPGGGGSIPPEMVAQLMGR